MRNKDTLYRSDEGPVKPFEFTQRVAEVFPDMIERSVPGYPLTIAMISVIADKYAQDNTNIYDLGCSLGAASIAIQKGMKNKSCHIIAIDNSQAMIDLCNINISQDSQNNNISFKLSDVLQTKIENASVVVMNFTLQFIPLSQRQSLIDKIYQGLLPGGVLVLSEKIVFEDDLENDVLNQLHHHMKELNGYERLEIANKRDALEKVLLPESLKEHQQRLTNAGFSQSFTWLKCFNFASLIARK
ncbi:MAG: carboxy-S-adenosyl-L-methionine synthase [marine bacterium B5-7]|nr:MAG: carboxy-S-adenosyl-L-methionine synthase [marine bacterium B5-7]